MRQRGDLNPCGQSPMDFESITLTTRSHCHVCMYCITKPSTFKSSSGTAHTKMLHVSNLSNASNGELPSCEAMQDVFEAWAWDILCYVILLTTMTIRIHKESKLTAPSRITIQRCTKLENASAGNRTRVTSMATMYSTTRPLMRSVRNVWAHQQPLHLG